MKYIKTYEQQNITTLNYSGQDLIELPELPDTLEMLYCRNNKLYKLPELPINLKLISCGKNNLTSLPKLPDTLETLSCTDNYLTKLNVPDNLQSLSCGNNYDLFELNFSEYKPITLKTLDCHNTSLPYKNLEDLKKWHEKKYPWIYDARRFNI